MAKEVRFTQTRYPFHCNACAEVARLKIKQMERFRLDYCTKTT